MNADIKTMIINEPLQSTIKRVANKKVYLTGNRVLSEKEFINKYFGGKAKLYKSVKKTRLGFVMVLEDRADLYPKKK